MYYGVCDTYVYDIESRTGYWMSGTENLDEFYSVELEEIRKLDEIRGWQFYYYLSYYIVTIEQERGYALMRRSDSIEGIQGKYYMRNLATGEETYICDSYTRYAVISFMDERYEWKSSDYLRIGIAAEPEEGWMDVYDVMFDGHTWIAKKTDENFDD